MKKILLGTVIAVGALLTACKENKPINVLVSADYPPFTFVEQAKNSADTPKIVGFEIDLFDEIAKKIGRKPNYVNTDFANILNGLQQKKGDAAIADITVTEERSKLVSFSTPYLSGNYALIVKDENIKNLEDLEGQAFGVLSGTSFEETFKNAIEPQFSAVKVENATHVTDLVAKLKASTIKTIFIGKAEADAVLLKDKSLKVIVLDIKKDSDVAVALPLDSTLKKEVDTAIENMLKDGTIEKLKKKWSID